MQERRRFERFDFKLSAKIEVTSGREKGKDTFILPTRDICAGGAFFHTVRSLPEGTQVEIDMVLVPVGWKGKQAQVEVKGNVVRSEAEGMAISFENHYQMRPRNGAG